MNEVIKRIQAGDKELLNKFVNDNMVFIESFIIKYKNIFNDYEDLKQTAIYMFIKSIYNYKFENDFYINHASLYILKYTKRYIVTNLDKFKDDEEKFNFCLKILEKYVKRHNKFPTPSELGAYLSIKSYYASNLIDIANGKINNVFDDVDLSIIPDSNTFDDDYLNKSIETDLFKKKVLDEYLTKRESKIIALRYGFLGDVYNFADSGRIIGCSRQAVHCVEQTAIKRLEKKCKNKLEKYL